jgi:SLOG in TRPM, prokaryote
VFQSESFALCRSPAEVVRVEVQDESEYRTGLRTIVPPIPDCTRLCVAGASAVMIASEQGLAGALDLLGLKSGKVLVLVGGAGSMSPHVGSAEVSNLFVNVLAPLAESMKAIVVDGGTDSGVMRLMGEARTKIRGTFPLVGVAAIETVDLPDRNGNGAETCRLEPGHSHFLIVPGERWGDESPWIARVASHLSAGSRSLTVVVNGGEITLRDIACSIADRRPLLVFAGSGRTADRVAAALSGGCGDPEIRTLVSSGLIQALDIGREPGEIVQDLRLRLDG